MNRIIDLDTYLRYRSMPMMPYIKTKAQKKLLFDSLSNYYEDACKKAEEFRNNYIKNGPDKGKAFVVDTSTFNIMWFMLYEKGDKVTYDYDGSKIEIGKCIVCKNEIGTWYVKTENDVVYINAQSVYFDSESFQFPNDTRGYDNKKFERSKPARRRK